MSKLEQYSQESNLNITYYFEYFGLLLSQRWVVFWGEEPTKVRPFNAWVGLTEDDYKKENYANADKLEWWTAYQEVKHDRLTNRKRATLKLTINALAGLFLAIITCRKCEDAMLQRNWISYNYEPGSLPFSISELLDEDFGVEEDRGRCLSALMTIESKLFTYAVGFCTEVIDKNMTWHGYASHRFTQWFNEYESLSE